MASSSHMNRNPGGNNQHGAVAKEDDEVLVQALRAYHREKLANNKTISERLLAEHGIKMSDTTVKRRRAKLGLVGSGKTMKIMSEAECTQAVLSQMDKDPSRRQGVRTIQNRIAFDQSLHIPRDFVASVMHTHDPHAFDLREPTAKKIFRVRKVPIGIHERWSGDGHDKLYKIGFPAWGVVDDATGRWLGAWIVPSNRMANIVAYCFLCLVEKYGGIPLQFTTDHGSETTQLFGLMNALRRIFADELDAAELPAHVYLQSIHNISIERSWLRLRLDFGDNAVAHFQQGRDDGTYNAYDPQQHELCQWLWAKLLNQELQAFMDFRNGTKMRKDRQKAGPSGMSRNDAFALPGRWGGRDCLIPVDVAVIREIKAAMGGDELLSFVSADFDKRAQLAYDSLHLSGLTFENVWAVFSHMRPLVFPPPPPT